MSAFFDFIFDHANYQKTVDNYALICKKFSKELEIFCDYYSINIQNITFEQKKILLQKKDEIISLNRYIKTYNKIIKNHKEGLNWFYYLHSQVKYLHKFLQYKEIHENQINIQQLDEKIKKCNNFINSYPNVIKYYYKKNGFENIPTLDYNEYARLSNSFKELLDMQKIMHQGDRYLKFYPDILKLFYIEKGFKDIPVFDYKQYKYINDNFELLSEMHNYIAEYKRLLTKYKNAICLYFKTTFIDFSYQEIKYCVDNKNDIIRFQEYFEKIYNCKKYPVAWKMFYKWDSINEIPNEYLELLDEKNFEQKEKFIHIYNQNKLKSNLILGEKDYVIDSFSKVSLEKEKKVIEYFQYKPILLEDSLLNRNYELLLNRSDIIKICILGHQKYEIKNQYYDVDKARNILGYNFFNGPFFDEVYLLRLYVEKTGKCYDELVINTDKYKRIISSYNKNVLKQNYRVYFEDYLNANLEDSDLHKYIQNYQNLVNIRYTAETILKKYPKGFSKLYNIDIFHIEEYIDSLSFEQLTEIVNNENELYRIDYKIKKVQEICHLYPNAIKSIYNEININNLSSNELDAIIYNESNIKLTENQIKYKEEQEKQKATVLTLKNSVTSWDTPNRSIVKYFSLYYYYPTTCDFNINENDKDIRYLIWNFKASPHFYEDESTTIKKNKISSDKIIPMLANVLKYYFGNNTSNLTFVCLPSKKAHVTKLRYEYFSEQLCLKTNMINGYGKINTIIDGLSKNEGGPIEAVYSIDNNFFQNKNVILFDDVITTGETLQKFKTELENKGATIIAAISIGKTTHSYKTEHPYNIFLNRI